MPEKAFTATIDRRAEERYLRRFSASEVTKIMQIANRESGKVGAAIVRSETPIGTSKRLSQYYRKMNLGHGTLRRSVRAAAIRGRHSALKGLQGNTVGSVIGPIGKNAFTRAWVELGTVPHDMSIRHASRHGGKAGTGRGMHPGEAANHWLEHVAPIALQAANDAAEAVLELYGRA